MCPSSNGIHSISGWVTALNDIAVAAERQQPPQYDLDVAARTRLHGHVFECFGLIEIAVEPPDPLAPEVDDDRDRRFNRHAATFPASPNPAHHEYPVTEIAVVLGEDPELAPCLVRDLEISLDAGSSVKASALHSTGQSRE